jgi:uncharacterized protein YraI
LKYFKLLLLIIILTTLSIILAQEDATPSAPANSVVIVSEAMLRSGPDVSYVAVGSLAENSILYPVNINEDGSWVLVEYRGGFGWIRRDLAFWGIAVDDLPVIYSNALTPTTAPTESLTPLAFATATPAGDYVLTTAVNALVRSGPGRNYSRMGRLYPGTVVEPVSIDESGDWVLIRYTDRIVTAVGFGVTLAPSFDGFAWVSRPLVAWTTDLSTLPVMRVNNLTPSPTPTPSNTPTATLTPSATITPTPTATLTATTAPTNTAVPTETSTNTATNTLVPTETSTNTATNTFVPTETSTNTATNTLIPTETSTNTATNTLVPTETSTNTATNTLVPTETSTNTATNTLIPTETSTNTATNTLIPTETSTSTEESAIAFVVTTEPSLTSEPTSTIEPSPSTQASQALEANQTALPTLAPYFSPDDPIDPSNRLPIELIIGGVVMGLAILYILLYIRGQSTVDRYINGAPIKTCPVCGDGALTVDTRIERSLGIPNGKHLIRCNKCRSVLRETEARQWRYAVDRSANPQLYMAYNNRLLSERELLNIQSTPLPSGKPIQKPQFSDEDTPPNDVN